MLQVVDVPAQGVGDACGRRGVEVDGRPVPRECGEYGLDVGARRGFVQGDAEAVRAVTAQVQAGSGGAGQDRRARLAGGSDGERIDEVLAAQLVAGPLERRGKQRGEAVYPLGDTTQAARTVVHGVERRHDREQRLCRADVARGFLAPDMLLAGLHGHAQGRAAVAVDGHADDAAGHGALEAVAGREKCGVRSAEAHGYAEALAAADHHVGTELAR